MTPPNDTPNTKLARAGLAAGLSGVGVGLFVGLGQWVNGFDFLLPVEPLPYVLGAVAMLLSIASIVVERRYRVGALAFLSGAAAVLVIPGMFYAVLALVAVVIVTALTAS